jgi:hypothetical protein
MMNHLLFAWASTLLLAAQPSDAERRREMMQKMMEARFHLQEAFDRDLSAKVPVSELHLPREAAGRFDENGDGFVTFDEIERMETRQKPEPEAPRDRSDFTHLREGGFPLNVNPETVPADEAVMDDDDIVMGVIINGEARAYPVNYMNGPYNEVVNDELGGQAISPSW